MKLLYTLIILSFGISGYTEKIFDIPDYTQTDESFGGFQENGNYYCAPVSASNSIIWLSENGYDDLNTFNQYEDLNLSQYYTIIDLSDAMSTDENEGTNQWNFCYGLKSYITDLAYSYVRLEYQGWRGIPQEFDTGVDIPNIEWIKEGIEGYASAWLHVGWYTYDENTDTYNRFFGHWITLVGHGFDSIDDNSDYLIAHDPSPRAGYEFSNEYILPVLIESGMLNGNYGGLPRSAEGYYKLQGGMHIHSNADFGILDGVVVLEMESPLLMGDINNDGNTDILDIILTVSIVLSNEYNESADMNSDGIIDILDIIQLVNIIIN